MMTMDTSFNGYARSSPPTLWPLYTDKDPHGDDYTDTALSPVTNDELDSFEMFNTTEAAKSAVNRVRDRSQLNVVH